jgi:hypothetical protein
MQGAKERRLSRINNTTQGEASEGNAADDALMVDQGMEHDVAILRFRVGPDRSPRSRLSTPPSASDESSRKTACKQANGTFPPVRSLRRPWLRSLRMSALPLSCSRVDMRRSGNIPFPCCSSATVFDCSLSYPRRDPRCFPLSREEPLPRKAFFLAKPAAPILSCFHP